jgi:hypothetical protein
MYVLSPEDLRCPATGKQAYPTEASALARVEVAWIRPQHCEAHAPMPRRAYECEHCHWWHLTSHWKRGEA